MFYSMYAYNECSIRHLIVARIVACTNYWQCICEKWLKKLIKMIWIQVHFHLKWWCHIYNWRKPSQSTDWNCCGYCTRPLLIIFLTDWSRPRTLGRFAQHTHNWYMIFFPFLYVVYCAAAWNQNRIDAAPIPRVHICVHGFVNSPQEHQLEAKSSSYYYVHTDAWSITRNESVTFAQWHENRLLDHRGCSRVMRVHKHTNNAIVQTFAYSRNSVNKCVWRSVWITATNTAHDLCQRMVIMHSELCASVCIAHWSELNKVH